MKRFLMASLAALVAVTPLAAQKPAVADRTGPMLKALDSRAPHYAEIAKQIWGFAEVGYQETKSSALLAGAARAGGLHGQARRRRHTDGVRRRVRERQTGHRHRRRVRRAARAVPGGVADAESHHRRRRRTRLRPQSLRHGLDRGRDRGEGVDDREPAQRERCGSTARPPRRAGRARSTWCATGCSRTWTP